MRYQARFWLLSQAGGIAGRFTLKVGTYSGGTTGTMTFTYADWLGNERVRTNIAGTGCETITSLPYGDNQVTSGSCGDPSPMHYTGKERDSESGLDNFGVRYDASSLGRFMSPDPGDFHFYNPQSLNRYTYTLNNPLFYVDPNGADSISAVYQLGTASVNTYVPSGQTLDTASMLASISGGFEHLPLGDLKDAQTMATPRELDTGGGCVLGCLSTFNEVPVGLSLNLSFNYDEKTGQITGANIGFEVNKSATFIESNPPKQRTGVSWLPGMTPGPQFFGAHIDSSVLGKLTTAQLQALDKATAGKKDAISQAVQNAVAAEEWKIRRRRSTTFASSSGKRGAGQFVWTSTEQVCPSMRMDS